MTAIYNNNDFKVNLNEILNTAFLNAMNEVNEKLLELYDELSDEDKLLITYEDFISKFKINPVKSF